MDVGFAQADCGCLVQSLAPEIIPPKKSAVLSFTFTAPDSFGLFRRQVLLSFREAEAPAIGVQIRGVIQPWCYAVPKEVDLGHLQIESGQESPTRTIVLHLRSGEKLDVATPPAPPRG